MQLHLYVYVHMHMYAYAYVHVYFQLCIYHLDVPYMSFYMIDKASGQILDRNRRQSNHIRI